MRTDTILALTLLGLTLTLGACSGARPQTLVDRDNDARLQGAELVLHEALDFAPRQVSLFIQHGKLYPSLRGIDLYRAHCKFELWTRLEEARRIEPDRFVIERVVRDYQLVQARPSPLRRVGMRRASDEWGSTTEIDTTLLYLRSARQPDVYRLSCEHWNDVSDARYLTPEQIQQTLEPRLSLILPPQ